MTTAQPAEPALPALEGASSERPTVPRYWRAADTVSALCTRLSFVVVAWLLLVHDQNWIRVGLVLTVQAVAFLAGGPLGAVALDRLDARQLSFATDLASAVVLAAVPFLTRSVVLLCLLVALLGLLRAVNDVAKLVLTGAAASIDTDDEGPSARSREWLVGVVVLVAGAAIGAVAAWLDAVGAIWVVAMLLAVCAAMVVRSAPATVPGSLPEPKLDGDPEPAEANAAAGSVADLWRQPLARRIGVVALLTGLFAFTGAAILGVVWVRDVFASPDPLGLVGGAFVVAAVAGGLVYTAVAAHPIRYLVLALGFAIGGSAVAVLGGLAPTELLVVVVALVVGLASATAVPVLGLVVANRVPARLRGRVGAVSTAVIAVAIPPGAFAASWIVERAPLLVAVSVGAACYLAAMLIPFFAYQTWQELLPAGETASILRRWPKLTGRLAVTLAYADGQWLVELRRGRALLGSRHAVGSAEALAMLAMLNVPALSRGVESALASDQSEASRQVDRVRGELAELEAKLTGLNEMVELNDAGKSGFVVH
jgi:MFS family permease